MVEQQQAQGQGAVLHGEAASGPRLAGVQFVAGTSRRTVILFVASVFGFWMGLYLYMPTLPTYVASKANDLAMVGVVLSMYGLWQAIIRIPVGVAADIVGRRKPFILGGMFLVGLAPCGRPRHGINGMIVGRAIVGLSAGTWVPAGGSFFSAPCFRRRRRCAPRPCSTWWLYLAGVGHRSQRHPHKVGGFELAYYLATAAAFVAILLMLPCKEERRPRVPPSFRSVFRLFGRKDVFLPTFLATVCQYAVWATTFGFVPILARELGATDVTLSLLTSVSLAVLTLGTFFASTLGNRVAPSACCT
jgi:MFS family permease